VNEHMIKSWSLICTFSWLGTLRSPGWHDLVFAILKILAGPATFLHIKHWL